MKFFLVLFLFFLCNSWAQQPVVTTDSTETQLVLVKGDTIPRANISLDEVLILPKLKLYSRNERRAYLILRRKTKKVFPYVLLAAERLDSLKQRLNRLESKREKKRYTRLVQRYINDEFKDELKKLSRTEGQILIKLIHRQTGITTFELIRELRSGWNAFWFNSTASLFNLSLKREYNPMAVKEDYYIEDILQREFFYGNFPYTKPAIDVKYLEAHAKWSSSQKPVKPNAPTN